MTGDWERLSSLLPVLGCKTTLRSGGSCSVCPVASSRSCLQEEVSHKGWWQRGFLGYSQDRDGLATGRDALSCCSGQLPPLLSPAAGTCGVLLRKVNGTAIVQLPSKRHMQVKEPHRP